MKRALPANTAAAAAAAISPSRQRRRPASMTGRSPTCSPALLRVLALALAALAALPGNLAFVATTTSTATACGRQSLITQQPRCSTSSMFLRPLRHEAGGAPATAVSCRWGRRGRSAGGACSGAAAAVATRLTMGAEDSDGDVGASGETDITYQTERTNQRSSALASKWHDNARAHTRQRQHMKCFVHHSSSTGTAVLLFFILCIVVRHHGTW